MKRSKAHTRIALVLATLGFVLSACAVSNQVAAYPYAPYPDPALYGAADLYDGGGWYVGDAWYPHGGWRHDGHWGHGMGHGGHFGGGHGGGHR